MKNSSFNPVLPAAATLPKTKTLAKPKQTATRPEPLNPTQGASPKSREEHMTRRRQQGTSLRSVAAEFGTSKSTAHRKTSFMKQGFNNLGPAD